MKTEVILEKEMAFVEVLLGDSITVIKNSFDNIKIQ